MESAHCEPNSGVSTLLIPSRHLDLLDRACAGSSINALLARLMAFALVPAEITSSILRTQYQSDGLNLSRCSFRVTNRTWFQLGQLARLHGVSRCRMFMVLLITWSNRLLKLRQQRRPVGQWFLTEFLSIQFPRTRTTTLIWKPAPGG